MISKLVFGMMSGVSSAVFLVCVLVVVFAMASIITHAIVFAYARNSSAPSCNL